MIEVRDLTVAFGRSLALDHVTLEVPPGVTGLFGPNGSGKSTLLRILTGLLRPNSGTVTVDGNDVDVRAEDFRRTVGYAGHEAGLYAHLTVGENLELFARLCGGDVTKVERLLADLDILDRRDDRVNELSAGLKRRVAIARALLHSPRLLLLDEPYANLDDDAAERVSQTIVGHVAPDGYAVVATHGAKRLKPIVTSSVVLRRGRVASFRSLNDSHPVVAERP